jgi:hypothetical protein
MRELLSVQVKVMQQVAKSLWLLVVTVVLHVPITDNIIREAKDNIFNAKAFRY